MATGGSAVQFAIIALTVLGLWIGARALDLVSGHFMVEAASTLARGVGISDW